MNKDKKFDCVQMKWDIQRKIEKEFSGVSDEEANKIEDSSWQAKRNLLNQGRILL